MSQHLQALEVFGHITQETLERTPITLGNWVHPYQPGDELQASSLGSTTAKSRRQQLPVMRTPRKEFGTPKTPSRYGSKNNDPHLRRMLSPALVTPDAETINERQKLEDSSALLQPHSSSWLVNAQRKLEDPNIKGFSLSTLASIPDWYYCCALHYRTSFSRTSGLGFGSEAAISCLLSHCSGKPHSY